MVRLFSSARIRRLQFSLGAVFILTAAVAIPLAVKVNRDRWRRLDAAAVAKSWKTLRHTGNAQFEAFIRDALEHADSLHLQKWDGQELLDDRRIRDPSITHELSELFHIASDDRQLRLCGCMVSTSVDIFGENRVSLIMAHDRLYSPQPEDARQFTILVDQRFASRLDDLVTRVDH